MENELIEINNEDIKNLIYTIRGKQVMLDSDVAMLYQCETKYVNRVVKRNIERFPEEFCFQLLEAEYESLRCQFVTLNKNGRGQHKKYMPYVFTEQGIAMLSALLKSEIAVKVSVKIMKAFIEMRKFLNNNGQILERLTGVEYKLLEHDKKFEEVFNNFQTEDAIKQKIFYKGQIWDSYSLIIDIIKRAKNKITIIDNYVDDSILKMLSKKNKDVEVVILTSTKSNIQNLDVQKFNKEYPSLKLVNDGKKIEVDDVMIDGTSTEDIGELVLKDREMLSDNGIVIVCTTLDKKSKAILAGPIVLTRGFVYVKDSADLIKEIERISKEKIIENTNNYYVEYNKIKNAIREEVGKYLYMETECKPMIITVIQEV